MRFIAVFACLLGLVACGPRAPATYGPTEFLIEFSSEAEAYQSLFFEFSAQIQDRLDRITDEEFFSGVNPTVSRGKLRLAEIHHGLGERLAEDRTKKAQDFKEATLKLEGLLSELSAEDSLSRDHHRHFVQLYHELSHFLRILEAQDFEAT